MATTVDKSLQFSSNPRKISERDKARLEEHLERLGDLGGVVFCRTHKAYVGGNQRSKIFDGATIHLIEQFDEPRKDKTVAFGFIEWKGNKYLYREVVFTDEEFREACIAANNDGGEWDLDVLASEWDQLELESFGFDTSVFDNLFQDDEPQEKHAGNLSDRFLVPPFSVLDTRRDYWQNRKKEWLSLGIKSEIGRDENITYAKSAQSSAIYELRNKLRAKNGIDPTWDEIEQYCKEHNIPFSSGTSVFDPVLTELCYRWFNIDGGKILDPFAGGSVRGIVASKLGYPYFGNDLRSEQIIANKENAHEVLGETLNFPQWSCGDSLYIDELTQHVKADLLFSCPPYADLEVYSNNPADISTMEYEDFLSVYRQIIHKSCELLNEDRFAIFVVSEIRDKKTGNYRDFIKDTIQAFEDAGLHYYNEIILINQIASLAIRVTNQFQKSRKIGRCHQNVLVFFKGNSKIINSIYPNLDFTDVELNLN